MRLLFHFLSMVIVTFVNNGDKRFKNYKSQVEQDVQGDDSNVDPAEIIFVLRELVAVEVDQLDDGHYVDGGLVYQFNFGKFKVFKRLDGPNVNELHKTNQSQ